MSKPTNCLRCLHYLMQPGYIGRGWRLSCKLDSAGLGRSMARWGERVERRQVTPPEWCPLQDGEEVR